MADDSGPRGVEGVAGIPRVQVEYENLSETSRALVDEIVRNEETTNKIKEIFEEDNPCAEIILPEPIRARGIRVDW